MNKLTKLPLQCHDGVMYNKVSVPQVLVLVSSSLNAAVLISSKGPQRCI